ncbi:MAG: hypothetical protein ABMA01_12255, partial [Chthoniobacteraceae bacterium]
NADRTMFLVTKYNSSTWWAGVAYGTVANNASFGLNVKNPTGELVLHGYGGGNDLVSTTPGIGAGWMVQSALLNGGTATHYKDGVQIGQWAHAYDTGLTKMVIGAEIGNLGFVGMDVGALLIYDRALSAGELASVQGYLQAKYFQTAPNTPPVVAITAPASGTNFTNGTAITFTGTASDTQQGNMNAAINWSSSINGALGVGASISVSSLSVGAHTITASVTDSGGLTGSASITVNIIASSNTAPVVTITAPASGSSYASGTAVTFTGTANDTQQGNMNAAINWTSSINGALGTGASISVSSLSIGTHTITASVTDSGGLTGSASVLVTIGTGGSGGLITSGLVVQLESDLNVALQTGNTVAAWLDQSGLGNDMVASGTPRLGTVLTPSGLPAVSFNGNGDKLERNGFLGGLPSGNANRTMFLVTKYNSSTWWGGVAYGTAANNASFGLNVKNPTGELVLHGYGGGNDLVSTTPGIGAGWMVQSVLLNGGTATHYKDGVQIGQWAHSYDTGLTKMVIAAEIGNLGFVGMDVGAVLIYNRALSAGELANVQGYLQAKYLQSGPNTPPVVTITAPSNGASFSSGIAVTLAGTANDTQQGNMNAAINWSSNINGALGTGASISVSSLSVGAHTITASVTDSGSLTGTASITVNITASSNTVPVVTITAPVTGSRYPSGATVAFTGTANDTQQGNMTAAINWSSNINGPIGTGGSISLSSLAVGTHTITASVTDSGGLTGTASISVTIAPALPPVTANLVVHLESAQGVTTSGAKVTSWADVSGRGNTVSGVGDPQLVQARTPGGRPAITCNGTTDKLERIGGLSGLPAANANRTVILVAKYNGSNAWAGFAYGTGASNQVFGLNVKHPTGELGLQGWGGGNDLISTTPGIGEGWLVQTGVLDSGTGTLFKDGTQIAQWAHAYNTVLSKMVIGAEIANLGFVNIEVAAVLVYDRALSASERASVEAYLRTKYL